MGSGDNDKITVLRKHGSLNRRPEGVKDPLFAPGGFFDPNDLVQVKYEMLRRVQAERNPISRVARSFGFSRPSFYQTQAEFEKAGLPGLVAKPRGPRGPHKVTPEVVAFLRRQRAEDPSVTFVEMTRRVRVAFGISVHRRTLARALTKKKRR